MAKIHPLPLPPTELDQSSSCSSSSKPSTFTVWMKSLVMQANGCTVYNENGEIVYRVDNYDKKGSSEVYLMDLKGRVLFTIRVWWFLNHEFIYDTVFFITETELRRYGFFSFCLCRNYGFSDSGRVTKVMDWK